MVGLDGKNRLLDSCCKVNGIHSLLSICRSFHEIDLKVQALSTTHQTIKMATYDDSNEAILLLHHFDGQLSKYPSVLGRGRAQNAVDVKKAIGKI